MSAQKAGRVAASKKDGAVKGEAPKVAAGNGATKGVEAQYTREEIANFLAEVAKRVVESNSVYFQSMIALNHLLRLPNAQELFDKDLREQARDLWLKVKSTGLQLNDPPLLFGDSKLPNEDEEDEQSTSTSEQRDHEAARP